MLGSFIKRGLSKEDCEGETMIQIMAGSDTTATAVRATLLNIVTHAGVYAKLQEEIDLAVKENRISKGTVTNAEAKQLPYLQAVIKEGLRVWPPLVGFLAKVAINEGDTFQGKYIPPGTRIGWAIWGVVQNPKVFGEDAKMFRPERWLEASPEQRALMDKTHELIFGAGKYGCLGKTVAFIELNKVFVEVILSRSLAL
jgi:cytochrome P450